MNETDFLSFAWRSKICFSFATTTKWVCSLGLWARRGEGRGEREGPPIDRISVTATQNWTPSGINYQQSFTVTRSRSVAVCLSPASSQLVCVCVTRNNFAWSQIMTLMSWEPELNWQEQQQQKANYVPTKIMCQSDLFILELEEAEASHVVGWPGLSRSRIRAHVTDRAVGRLCSGFCEQRLLEFNWWQRWAIFLIIAAEYSAILISWYWFF